MGKNKWLEKAGVYELIEEKGCDKLTEEIERAVGSLAGIWSGGEEQSSRAFSKILKNVKNGTQECVEEVCDYISRMSETKNKENVGKRADDMADEFSSYLIGIPENAAKRAVKGTGFLALERSYISNFLSHAVEIVKNIPEEYWETAISDIKDSHYSENYVSESYIKIFQLPDECRKTALDTYNDFKHSPSEALSIISSYSMLSKVFTEKELPENIEKIRKIANILGVEKAIARADKMAADQVEKDTGI